MCRICGNVIANKNCDHHWPEDCDAMLRSMHRGGPDDTGSYISDSAHLYLGHNRLSIIDLTQAGHQPMSDITSRYTIVFNGEIYNYKELKSDLFHKGHSFVSNCDTEVILYAFAEWGKEAFAKLNGMFAFALWDQEKERLYLVRDHAGIKPFYYSLDSNNLLFGSEVRSFKAYNPAWKTNPNWENYFLSFGFIPYPYTTLENVFSLGKGEYLEYNLKDFSSKIHNYNTFVFTNIITSEKEAIKQIRDCTIAAVERQLISDAPIGIFLSGGIDSSLLALIADYLGHSNLNTLSVIFNETQYSEEPYQKKVLSRMKPHNHQAFNIDGNMFISVLDDIFDAMDQPSIDGVNSYFIAKSAHQFGLKTVLSGIGGDELFAGYPSFSRIKYLSSLQKIPAFLKATSTFLPHEGLSRISFLRTNHSIGNYLFLRGIFQTRKTAAITGHLQKSIQQTLNNIILTNYPTTFDANLASYLETNVYMENQLLKDTDYMSMWHSLEVRVPFLDRELMELMHRIDPVLKFNSLQPKHLLTKAFEDILPREIIFRKKQGFTFPFGIWLRNSFAAFKPLIPDTPATKSIIKGFFDGNTHWSKVWALIVWNKFKTD